MELYRQSDKVAQKRKFRYVLTLFPTAFKFFSDTGGGGGELFGPHPKKHSLDNLIDSQFGTANYWHKTRKST